jgi:P-type Ca2+ transporter type 2C
MSQSFDIQWASGLTEQAAARRLTEDGYNELPHGRRRNTAAIALEVVREPMFLLLVACGVVYLLMGEPKEALMLLGFVFVIMGITIIQERRTERALDALRDLSSPRALVVRDGRQRRIPGREVVQGDILILVEGDRVPADALVLDAVSLAADESLLTGESVPVRKRAGSERDSDFRPGGDDLPVVFSGTLITQGQGIADVTATGLRTELGRIGKALQSVEPEKTTLQRETGRLVRNLAAVGLTLCAAVVVIYAITRGNTALAWKQGFLAGIATAMATLPEEFPVVLTIFLALGAWRISQKQVLTRRIPAVETLGAATVLCVDKTGTLTQNRMSIRKLYADGRVFDAGNTRNISLTEEFHSLVEFGILASRKDPFDPMDKALKSLGAEQLAKTEHLHENWELVREYPLSPELLALSHVWRSPDGREIMVAAKGAPEAVADLCHFSDEQREELSGRVESLAGEGLRVLGVARGLPVSHSDLPKNQHDFEFTFLGLVGLADPIRPAVPAAIQQCYTAGIRVIMITGDYPGTAQSIGREIGLRNVEQVVTGPELDSLSEEQLRDRLATTNIIARVVPEQKLRIVEALKSRGEVVAMTGDGVNDAPALKAAHIGVAMGGRGTDVARESAGLVLLDDDFSSIVQAVRLGRRIFDNIRKAVSYIFAIHVPIAGLSLIPAFFSDWPLILMPVHIVFLELIIDPSCTLIFEAEDAEPDVMTRPPRDPKAPLFGLKSVAISLLQGLCVLAIILGVYMAARFFSHSDNNARGLTFASLVVANLALILTNRSWSRTILATLREPNKALWWVVGGAAAFLGLVIYTPFFRDLFHFSPLHAIDLAICLLAGGVSTAWFECLKLAHRRKAAQGVVGIK